MPVFNRWSNSPLSHAVREHNSYDRIYVMQFCVFHRLSLSRVCGGKSCTCAAVSQKFKRGK